MIKMKLVRELINKFSIFIISLICILTINIMSQVKRDDGIVIDTINELPDEKPWGGKEINL